MQLHKLTGLGGWLTAECGFDAARRLVRVIEAQAAVAGRDRRRLRCGHPEGCPVRVLSVKALAPNSEYGQRPLNPGLPGTAIAGGFSSRAAV
jgi:hypothetical protein